MPTTPRPQPVALRIELLEVAPLVWRRVLVSNQWTLASLHGYLQWVMGWTDTHAHEFEVGEGIVAPDWWIEEIGYDRDTSGYRDERRVSVAAVASEQGIRGEFEYRYDMGDGWRHRIVVESLPLLAEAPELRLPVCLAGENACPPEDVGGPPGYAMFLEILTDRGHEQHQGKVRWIGGVFDPRGFDLNRLNRDFKGEKKRRGWEWPCRERGNCYSNLQTAELQTCIQPPRKTQWRRNRPGAAMTERLPVAALKSDHAYFPAMNVFTVGYEGLELEGFLRQLRHAGVRVLVDVRDLPLSRKRGFSKTALAEALGGAGMA